ncbi:MAG: ParA family protein, partial [bacterium]
LEAEKRTTLSILLDDDTTLNPYHLQVPGNHEPPKVSQLATPIFNFKHGGKLDLVPSTLDLMYIALGQSDTKIQPMEERFQKFVSECRREYDIIFIDCHPAGSLFTKTSLRNSDHVLIPVVPQKYSVRGIGLMMKFIDAKKVGAAAPMAHILFNATSRQRVMAEEQKIRNTPEFSTKCLTATLKKFSAFSEPEAGSGFVWVSKKPHSTSAFNNLISVTTEFLDRIGA